MTTDPSTERRARAELERTAAAISETALALERTHADTAGEYIATARRVRTLGLRLLTDAVLLERARGASWLQVAAATGLDEPTVRARWEDHERERAQHLRVAHDAGVMPDVDAG